MRTMSQMNGKKKISETKFPFVESNDGLGYSIRKFSSGVDDLELVWHRDRENRIIEVISGDEWMFQYDNSIPRKIRSGDVLFINKNERHRVIRGSSDLVIKINKF